MDTIASSLKDLENFSCSYMVLRQKPASKEIRINFAFPFTAKRHL